MHVRPGQYRATVMHNMSCFKKDVKNYVAKRDPREVIKKAWMQSMHTGLKLDPREVIKRAWMQSMHTGLKLDPREVIKKAWMQSMHTGVKLAQLQETYIENTTDVKLIYSQT